MVILFWGRHLCRSLSFFETRKKPGELVFTAVPGLICFYVFMILCVYASAIGGSSAGTDTDTTFSTVWYGVYWFFTV